MRIFVRVLRYEIQCPYAFRVKYACQQIQQIIYNINFMLGDLLNLILKYFEGVLGHPFIVMP